MKIRRLLVANRGEIAMRVIRAAHDLGIETVAVYSEADRGARHTCLADRAICIGPGPAPSSYLRGDLLVHTALATGCAAVHPGYGFLSEDAGFAASVGREGLIFVGPSPAAISQMGDKAIARAVVRQAGVRVVPGSPGVVADAAAAAEQAADFGYPVLLKARAGGGGRGMRIVRSAHDIAQAFAVARQEAAAAFGDDGLYVEKYLPRARHVEIQVLADETGKILHLGERDCSIQRRHQKVLEEAPSPYLNETLRTEMGEAAVRAAAVVGYTGAGTVEFLVDTDRGDFYFIEMNTRIQVEHGLTEELTGIDLVSWQLRIANGEKLDFGQADVALRGHAIELRINAEDPARDFMPSPGTLRVYQLPGGPGVRVDTHCVEGTVIPPYYDPLIAKIILTGRDRNEALRRARRALEELRVEGVETNVSVHRWLLGHPDFAAGNYLSTSLACWWEAHLRTGKETT